MPNYTDNLNLALPLGNERPDINVINNNSVIIDAAISEEKQNRINQNTILTKTIENEVKRATDAEKDIKDNTYNKTEIDNKFTALESGIDWKESVKTFSDIDLLYPNPEDGWTVNVKDTDYTYRYNGNSWVPISANAIPLANNLVDGKMSSEDFIKLSGIENNAQRNVNPDWAETDILSSSYIKNKPTIPLVNDGTLTIKQGSTILGTFSANQENDLEIIISDSEGSGSSVLFTQLLSEGTKIGTITIDDTDTDIYAPDTKNTAGTTNKTATKMFLAGATEQSANPQTYSNSNVYIGTDNELYSNSKKVAHAEDVGTLASLTTTEKGSTVGAINELNTNLTNKLGYVQADTDLQSYISTSKNRINLVGLHSDNRQATISYDFAENIPLITRYDGSNWSADKMITNSDLTDYQIITFTANGITFENNSCVIPKTGHFIQPNLRFKVNNRIGANGHLKIADFDLGVNIGVKLLSISVLTETLVPIGSGTATITRNNIIICPNVAVETNNVVIVNGLILY